MATSYALGRGGEAVAGLVVRICLIPDGVVVSVDGEVDLATVTQLRDHLRALPDGDVIVDLSGVRFLAVVGMRALLELQGQRHHAGARVVLAATDGPITQVLKAAGCHATFTVVDCVERAKTLIDERGPS